MRTVRDLLNAKGRQIHSIAPEASVFDALKLMADRNIGAVLVVDREDRLVGILSERDYARKVVLHGHNSRETPVSAIMTGSVVCIPADTTLDECMGLMTVRHIRHLPSFDCGCGFFSRLWRRPRIACRKHPPTP